MPKLKTANEWLRASAKAPPIGVDRENNIIRGYVVAQRGPFKSEGRGEFDDKSLSQIVSLMAAKSAGTKARFSHPSLSSDGIGTFLGRAKDPRLDNDRVRADLYLDASSFDTPNGNLGKYVLDLAESDPDALSSSLVLHTEKVSRLDGKGRPLTDDKGNELPPLWYPTAIHASDLVDTGDAVDGLLSAGIEIDGLSDAIVRRGVELLDRQFAGKSPEFIRERCRGWLERYLSLRFGSEASEEEVAEAATTALRQRMASHKQKGIDLSIV